MKQNTDESVSNNVLKDIRIEEGKEISFKYVSYKGGEI